MSDSGCSTCRALGLGKLKIERLIILARLAAAEIALGGFGG
jgi:hypothetical protein